MLRATTACTFWTSQLPKVVRRWCVLYILTSKCASRHNGVQFFISHLASCLRTRRFSEPTFRASGAPNHWKNTVFRDFPTFSRICIFFLLTLSLLSSNLSLLSASALLCFSSVHIVGSLTSKLPSIITVTDASFSNEKNYKSQQGRFHFLGDINEIKDPQTASYRVMPLGFASNTIRRVCRSTLQCEAYSLQAGQESGDKLRGALAELMGQLDSMKTWLDDSRSCIPHLMLSDCRSLRDHLASEVLGRVADKRLAIELQSINESLWQDGRRTWDMHHGGGDMVIWIATGTMVSDALTKSMRPDLIIRVLKECIYRVQKKP